VRNVLPGVVRKMGTSVGDSGFWLGGGTQFTSGRNTAMPARNFIAKKSFGCALADAGMEVASRIGARCLGDCGA